MFGYYNEHQIRKAIVAFGSLFSRIFVQRKESDGRQVAPPYLVPIRYSPGGKTYILSRERPVTDKDSPESIFQRSIPRLGFEMTGISLNSGRQKKTVNEYVFPASDDVVSYKEGVAITLSMSLYVLAENNYDMYTIIEQILPYFKPAIPVEISGDPFPCNFTSMLKLTGISVEDNYEGDLGEPRQIIAELSFDMEFMLFAGVEINPEDVAGDDFQCVYDIENLKTGITPVINKIYVDFYSNEVVFDLDGAPDVRISIKALPEGALDESASTGIEETVTDNPASGNPNDQDWPY